MSGRAVVHALTVDVEEYFQVAAFEDTISRGDWPALPSRVESQVERLLETLAAHEVKGTFFVLGWVADATPDVVRRIAAAGHEIASHGWWHRRIPELEPEAFRREARDSKRLLEQITARPVLGFRAPNFSLLPGYEWALDILIEEGYRYDSSLFPAGWLRPGFPWRTLEPGLVSRPSGAILELLPSPAVWAGVRVGVAGGAYFRQLPYAVTRRALRRAERDGRPGTFYLHPWELDPAQPRLPVPPTARLRHYRNLERTGPRLERLLREFRFTTVIDAWGLEADPAPRASALAGEPA